MSLEQTIADNTAELRKLITALTDLSRGLNAELAFRNVIPPSVPPPAKSMQSEPKPARAAPKATPIADTVAAVAGAVAGAAAGPVVGPLVAVTVQDVTKKALRLLNLKGKTAVEDVMCRYGAAKVAQLLPQHLEPALKAFDAAVAEAEAEAAKAAK